MPTKSNIWFTGPPPSVGWWPASRYRTHGVLRWWNGECWSLAADRRWTAEDAAMSARCKDLKGDIEPPIEWQHRPSSWPEQSKT